MKIVSLSANLKNDSDLGSSVSRALGFQTQVLGNSAQDVGPKRSYPKNTLVIKVLDVTRDDD